MPFWTFPGLSLVFIMSLSSLHMKITILWCEEYLKLELKSCERTNGGIKELRLQNKRALWCHSAKLHLQDYALREKKIPAQGGVLMENAWAFGGKNQQTYTAYMLNVICTHWWLFSNVNEISLSLILHHWLCSRWDVFYAGLQSQVQCEIYWVKFLSKRFKNLIYLPGKV